MRTTERVLKARKLTFSILLAISLMVVLTAAVSASSQSAIWSGVGQVVFSGPSQDPATPTVTESKFRIARNGTVKSVEINTTNEFFAGVLGGGAGGGAITECKDRRGSTACEDLEAMLTGATLTSIHNSKATLSKVSQGEIQVPLPTPAGPVVLNVPVLSGAIRGRLQGAFALSNVSGIAEGTAELKIGKGSSATYACFAQTPAGPVPLESLQPCIDNAGGQLFPVLLDVEDSGKFEIGAGSGSMAGILGLSGKVIISLHADLLQQQFRGSIEIPKAKASLVGDDERADENEDDDRRRGGRNSSDD